MVQGCGLPGDLVTLPHTFLAGLGANISSGGEARTFVHLWARYSALYCTVLYCTVLWPRYRYGIFDDTGCGADPLYPSFYRRHGRTLASATTNIGDTEGSDVDRDTGDTGGNATCSLGAGVGSRYCDPAVDQVAVTPTLQVLYCTVL